MIYLDHNATTPTDERVVASMQPFLNRCYGNPSSLYRWGRLARDAVEEARVRVASLAGAQPSQVIFTSGGTESNNLALQGWCLAHPDGALAVSCIEHPSILETANALARRKVEVAWLKADPQGRVMPESVMRWQKNHRVGLISCMLANNETGVIQPVAELSRIANDKGLVFHTDAVQAAGRMQLDFSVLNVKMMSLSAHKIHGPKGAGALILDRSLRVEPLFYGGGQEGGLRGGTENVAAIVGFGMAAELAGQERESRVQHLFQLRRRLEAGLEELSQVTVFGEKTQRLPNTVQLAIPGIDGEMLLMMFDKEKIAVSSGSACASGGSEPSHVLLAMGVDANLAKCAIRISLGKDNTVEDVDHFLAVLAKIVKTFGITG